MPFDRKKYFKYRLWNKVHIQKRYANIFGNIMSRVLVILLTFEIFALSVWVRSRPVFAASKTDSLPLRHSLLQLRTNTKNSPNSVKVCICEWPCFERTFIWFLIHFFNTLDPFQIYFYNRLHRLNGIGKSYLAYYHPRHRTKRYCAMLQYTLHIKHTSYVYKNIISFESKKEK